MCVVSTTSHKEHTCVYVCMGVLLHTQVLLQIVKDEGRVLSKAAADQLAHSAHGDLRHAVQALQLMFSRTADTGPQGPKRATGQVGLQCSTPTW